MSNALEIKKCILDVGKTKFIYNTDSKDYTFNGLPPRSIPKDYFSQIHKKFLSLLITQLKENSTKELLNKYIETTKNEIKNIGIERMRLTVTFNDRKAKGFNTDENDDDFEDIKIIISVQKSVLLKIQSKLETEIEFVGYKTSADYQEENEIIDLDTSNIHFSDSGKLTFKMNKKTVLMFLFILKKLNLIEYEDKQEIRFIQNNFNYTELRENNSKFNKPCPMIGVRTEISNFESNDNATIKGNNKTLEILLKKFKETIHMYEFKITKNKS
jgi:hypothetical protein